MKPIWKRTLEYCTLSNYTDSSVSLIAVLILYIILYVNYHDKLKLDKEKVKRYTFLKLRGFYSYLKARAGPHCFLK